MQNHANAAHQGDRRTLFATVQHHRCRLKKHRSQASITSSRDLTDNIHLAGLGAAGCQCFLPLHLTGLLFLFYFDQRLQLP